MANDFEREFRTTAAEVHCNDFYVDDGLMPFLSVEAVKLIVNVKQMCNKKAEK